MGREFVFGKGGEVEVGLEADFGNLAADQGRQAKEGGGGQILAAAFIEFGFEGIELFGQAGEFEFVGGEDAVLEGFELDGAELADFGLEAAVPVGDAADVDVEFFGDAGQAPALGAQFNEPVSDLRIIHSNTFLIMRMRAELSASARARMKEMRARCTAPGTEISFKIQVGSFIRVIRNPRLGC